MWSNELGMLPIKMPSLLKPGQPCKDSLGTSSEPVCEAVRIPRAHSLLPASACPLSFFHLAHTFFSPLPSSFAPSSLSPKATIVWVPVTPPRLLTSHSSLAIFLAVGRTCTSVFGSQLLTHSGNSICLKNLFLFHFSFMLSLNYINFSYLYILQLACSPFPAFQMRRAVKSEWVKLWSKLGIKVYPPILNRTNNFNFSN